MTDEIPTSTTEVFWTQIVPGLAALAFGAWLWFGVFGGDDDEGSGASDPVLHSDECLADTQCGGRSAVIRHTRDCMKLIEGHAKHAPKWTDSLLNPIFSRYRRVGEGNVFQLIGDQVQLQNSFGAWTRYRYNCEVDYDSGQARLVTMEPGQL